MSTVSTLERTRRSVLLSTWVVVAGSSLVLLAWRLGLHDLVNPLGGEPMRPLTALCFLGASGSLLAWLRPTPRKELARGLALLVLGLAAIGLVQRGFDVRLGIDAILSGSSDPSLAMAMLPGSVFVILALALLLFDRTVGPLRVPELLGLVGTTTALVCGIDLFLGLFTDADWPARTMSPYAAALLFLLSQSVVLAQPTHGWMRALTSDTASARTGQQLLSVVAPIILGLSLVGFLGEEEGLYDSRTGVALMAGGAIITLVLTSWRALAQIHRFELDLVQARALVDAIVENIPHMIFVKDADLRFVRFNAAGERLLGVTRDALLGKDDFDLFPKEQAEFFQAKDKATLSGRSIVDIPEEQIDTQNGKRWLRTVKVPIQTGTSERPFLLGLSEDITERKRADDDLRHAKEAAEATSRELEAFSYSVSHDLRAPLRSIDGFSQAILEDCGDKLDDEGLDHLRRVRGAAQKMAALIDDMLDLSRVSRQEMKREPVDVSAIAQSVVDELRRVAPERDVDVVIAPGLTTIGDARLIEVLLENLIGNAWKFTRKKAKARIEVGATTVDREHRFFVKDDGAGFDMTYVGKLFGAFQRLHTATEFEGTGIGLATVQRIAHRHGGRVTADGALDRGATFTFTFGHDAEPAETGRKP